MGILDRTSSRNIFLEGLWFKLIHVEGIGNKGLRQIAARLLSSQRALSGDFKEDWPLLRDSMLKDKKEALQRAYLDPKLEEHWQSLVEKGIGLLYPQHPLLLGLLERAYTTAERGYISSLPAFLFYWGRLEVILDSPMVGVIGSREADDYLQAHTSSLVEHLSAQGVTILSGYARGIDSFAHAASLNHEGYTAAVLPHGISGVFSRGSASPFLKTRLARELRHTNWTQNLLFLSQFYPESRWQVPYFILRNYTICALSRQLVVMASTHEQSGSYQTALIARRLGTPLYVFMPKKKSEQSLGNRHLCERNDVIPLDEKELLSLTI